MSTRLNRIPRLHGPATIPTAPGPIVRLSRWLRRATHALALWHAERRAAHLACEIEALEAHMLADKLVLEAHTLPRLCADLLERRAADDACKLERLYLQHACATLRLRGLQGKVVEA